MLQSLTASVVVVSLIGLLVFAWKRFKMRESWLTISCAGATYFIGKYQGLSFPEQASLPHPGEEIYYLGLVVVLWGLGYLVWRVERSDG